MTLLKRPVEGCLLKKNKCLNYYSYPWVIMIAYRIMTEKWIDHNHQQSTDYFPLEFAKCFNFCFTIKVLANATSQIEHEKYSNLFFSFPFLLNSNPRRTDGYGATRTRHHQHRWCCSHAWRVGVGHIWRSDPCRPIPSAKNIIISQEMLQDWKEGGREGTVLQYWSHAGELLLRRNSIIQKLA